MELQALFVSWLALISTLWNLILVWAPDPVSPSPPRFKEKLRRSKEESEFSVLLEMEWWYQHLYAQLNPKSSMKTISQWKWWIGSISGGSIRFRFSSSFWTHLIMKWKLNVTFWLPQYFEKWFILCSPILKGYLDLHCVLACQVYTYFPCSSCGFLISGPNSSHYLSD